MALYFTECQNEEFDLLTIYNKTHKSEYYHYNTSGSEHNTSLQIILSDKLKIISACTNIKRYLNLQQANAKLNLFLQINKDSE
ncbi:12856_t:CDS:1, partial [Cetraspora pellucida]